MTPSPDNSQSQLPTPGDVQIPGPGGGFPVAQPSQPDGREATTALLVAQLVQASRRLAVMYPAATEEMRTIQNAIGRAQQKIVASKPAPDASAPPV